MIKHSVSSLFVSGEANVRAEGEDVASFGLPSVRQSTCAWATVDPPQFDCSRQIARLSWALAMTLPKLVTAQRHRIRRLTVINQSLTRQLCLICAE